MVFNTKLPLPLYFQGNEYDEAVLSFNMGVKGDNEIFIEKGITDTITLFMEENGFFEMDSSEIKMCDLTPVFSLYIVFDVNSEFSDTMRFSLLEDFNIEDHSFKFFADSDETSLITTVFLLIGQDALCSDLENPTDIYSFIAAFADSQFTGENFLEYLIDNYS